MLESIEIFGTRMSKYILHYNNVYYFIPCFLNDWKL